MFEDVLNEVAQSRNYFSENVRDAFGASVCNELYDKLKGCVDTAEMVSTAADLREAGIRAQLLELRSII